MTDKEYREEKRRIKKLLDKWITPLGLRWWKVNLEFRREATGNRDDGRCSVASTMVDWHYLNATITFNISAVADQSDDELETVFVHECGHILINEMRMWSAKDMEPDKNDEAMHHEERVVTTLANAFIWTREAGRKDAATSERKPKRKLSARK